MRGYIRLRHPYGQDQTPPAPPALGTNNPPWPNLPAGTPPRPGFVSNRYQAQKGALVNALSYRATSPPPDHDRSDSPEVCSSYPRNNNTSLYSALIDSGSSVNTVPHQQLLTSFVPSSGQRLTATNGSSIKTLGHGSYSPTKNITLTHTELTPSIDSLIISVSSLIHDNNKIVAFIDPISYIIPNLTYNESLNQLISTASVHEHPQLFKYISTERIVYSNSKSIRRLIFPCLYGRFLLLHILILYIGIPQRKRRQRRRRSTYGTASWGIAMWPLSSPLLNPERYITSPCTSPLPLSASTPPSVARIAHRAS